MELSKSVHKKRISHRFGEDIPTIRVQKYYLHFYHVHVKAFLIMMTSIIFGVNGKKLCCCILILSNLKIKS